MLLLTTVSCLVVACQTFFIRQAALADSREDLIPTRSSLASLLPDSFLPSVRFWYPTSARRQPVSQSMWIHPSFGSDGGRRSRKPRPYRRPFDYELTPGAPKWVSQNRPTELGIVQSQKVNSLADSGGRINEGFGHPSRPHQGGGSTGTVQYVSSTADSSVVDGPITTASIKDHRSVPSPTIVTEQTVRFSTPATLFTPPAVIRASLQVSTIEPTDSSLSTHAIESQAGDIGTSSPVTGNPQRTTEQPTRVEQSEHIRSPGHPKSVLVINGVTGRLVEWARDRHRIIDAEKQSILPTEQPLHSPVDPEQTPKADRNEPVDVLSTQESPASSPELQESASPHSENSGTESWTGNDQSTPTSSERPGEESGPSVEVTERLSLVSSAEGEVDDRDMQRDTVNDAREPQSTSPSSFEGIIEKTTIFESDPPWATPAASGVESTDTETVSYNEPEQGTERSLAPHVTLLQQSLSDSFEATNGTPTTPEAIQPISEGQTRSDPYLGSTTESREAERKSDLMADVGVTTESVPDHSLKDVMGPFSRIAPSTETEMIAKTRTPGTTNGYATTNEASESTNYSKIEMTPTADTHSESWTGSRNGIETQTEILSRIILSKNEVPPIVGGNQDPNHNSSLVDELTNSESGASGGASQEIETSSTRAVRHDSPQHEERTASRSPAGLEPVESPQSQEATLDGELTSESTTITESALAGHPLQSMGTGSPSLIHDSASSAPSAQIVEEHTDELTALRKWEGDPDSHQQTTKNPEWLFAVDAISESTTTAVPPTDGHSQQSGSEDFDAVTVTESSIFFATTEYTPMETTADPADWETITSDLPELSHDPRTRTTTPLSVRGSGAGPQSLDQNSATDTELTSLKATPGPVRFEGARLPSQDRGSANLSDLKRIVEEQTGMLFGSVVMKDNLADTDMEFLRSQTQSSAGGPTSGSTTTVESTSADLSLQFMGATPPSGVHESAGSAPSTRVAEKQTGKLIQFGTSVGVPNSHLQIAENPVWLVAREANLDSTTTGRTTTVEHSSQFGSEGADCVTVTEPHETTAHSGKSNTGANGPSQPSNYPKTKITPGSALDTVAAPQSSDRDLSSDIEVAPPRPTPGPVGFEGAGLPSQDYGLAGLAKLTRIVEEQTDRMFGSVIMKDKPADLGIASPQSQTGSFAGETDSGSTIATELTTAGHHLQSLAADPPSQVQEAAGSVPVTQIAEGETDKPMEFGISGVAREFRLKATEKPAWLFAGEATSESKITTDITTADHSLQSGRQEADVVTVNESNSFSASTEFSPEGTTKYPAYLEIVTSEPFELSHDPEIQTMTLGTVDSGAASQSHDRDLHTQTELTISRPTLSPAISEESGRPSGAHETAGLAELTRIASEQTDRLFGSRSMGNNQASRLHETEEPQAFQGYSRPANKLNLVAGEISTSSDPPTPMRNYVAGFPPPMTTESTEISYPPAQELTVRNRSDGLFTDPLGFPEPRFTNQSITDHLTDVSTELSATTDGNSSGHSRGSGVTPNPFLETLGNEHLENIVNEQIRKLFGSIRPLVLGKETTNDDGSSSVRSAMLGSTQPEDEYPVEQLPIFVGAVVQKESGRLERMSPDDVVHTTNSPGMRALQSVADAQIGRLFRFSDPIRS